MWYKIAGIVFLFGSIIFIRKEFRILEVSRTGKLVSVEIFNKDCGNYRGRDSFVFIHEGKEHWKKCGSAFCRDLIIGGHTNMIVNKDSSVFLYPSENPIYGIVSWVLLGGFGIFLLLRKR